MDQTPVTSELLSISLDTRKLKWFRLLLPRSRAGQREHGESEDTETGGRRSSSVNFPHSQIFLPERSRSQTNAEGQAHFSQQARIRRGFDHPKPVIDPQKMCQSRAVNGDHPRESVDQSYF